MNRLKVRLDDEQGVTIVVAAIAMVVLMGAVAMSLDVGGLMYRRRAMVNGADSAALAAAIACSKGDRPETQADAHFLANTPGATPGDVGGTNITQIVGCGQGSGHVVVTYTTQQPLYFAPVLGFGAHHAVSTTATASWGSAGAPFPISVNLGPANAFHSCPIEAQPGQDCYYLFDNNANGGGDFGFLNVAQWGAQSDQVCNASGGASLIRDEITGIAVYPLFVFRPPDYVCQVSGLKSSNWAASLASLRGQTRSFPINDPSRQTQKRWYIVGFARMSIVDVDTNVSKNQSCGGLIAQNGSNTCVHLIWEGGGVGQGPQQLETINLCDMQYRSCLDQ